MMLTQVLVIVWSSKPQLANSRFEQTPLQMFFTLRLGACATLCAMKSDHLYTSMNRWIKALQAW